MPLNKAARNERVKITATWLNSSAVAALAIGGFGPIAGTTLSPQPLAVSLNLVASTVGWLFVSLGLHVAARLILRRIEE